MIRGPRAVTLLAVVLVAGSSACGIPATDRNCAGATVRLIRPEVLTVGTDFAFPPFAFDDPQTGETTGFDVDLAGAIADQIGARLLLVNRTSAALVPGLLAQRHDLAASALVDGPSLRREVCVSSPYLPADLALAARAGDPPSATGVGDLEGRSVAVVRGGRAEDWLSDNGPADVRLVSMEASEDLLVALRASEVDAVMDDEAILRHARPEGVVIVETIGAGQYVLAAAPDNLGLMELVNEALAHLEANGTLRSLERKWFGG